MDQKNFWAFETKKRVCYAMTQIPVMKMGANIFKEDNESAGKPVVSDSSFTSTLLKSYKET